MKQNTPERLDTAHRRIAEAMVGTVGLWFVPVVSGVACNFSEKALITSMLRDLGREGNAAESDEVFWFIRKKMLLLNAGTYIPYAGTALQAMEVYAMGQFAIRCAVDLEELSDSGMRAAWTQIEQDILSARNLVAFYEGFSGNRFPEQVRQPFETSIDEISRAYRGLMRIPGLQKVQEGAGEGIRQAITFVDSQIQFVKDEIKIWKAKDEADMARVRELYPSEKVKAIRAKKAPSRPRPMQQKQPRLRRHSNRSRSSQEVVLSQRAGVTPELRVFIDEVAVRKAARLAREAAARK